MGVVILACFKHRGGEEFQDIPYTSFLDIPIRALIDSENTEAKPIREHAPDKKAYLVVNVAST